MIVEAAKVVAIGDVCPRCVEPHAVDDLVFRCDAGELCIECLEAVVDAEVDAPIPDRPLADTDIPPTLPTGATE